MSRFTVPTFFQFLDLLIKAFHLDEGRGGVKNDLRGNGRFQLFLTGRSVDLSDQKLFSLLKLFSQSMLDSEVFPALRASLRDALQVEPDTFAFEITGAPPLPKVTGNQDHDMAHRLAWLATAQEQMLASARSDDSMTDLIPTFGLIPLVRFAGHHLAVVLALMSCSGQLPADRIDAGSLEWSWGHEAPDRTPMRTACEAAGMSRGFVRRSLQQMASKGSHVVRSDTTIDNLWSGGVDHPELETMRAVVQVVAPNDPSALPQWRRWYGLRFLARRCADQWGWQSIASWLNEIHHVARRLSRELPSQNTKFRREQLASTANGLWATWRMTWIRMVLLLVCETPDALLSPSARRDFAYIGYNCEHRRFVQCFRLAASSHRKQRELEANGLGASAARQRALDEYRLLEGEAPDLVGRGPQFLHEHAAARNDFRGMERAARGMLALDDVPEHRQRLVISLGHQHRFEEALAEATEACRRHPDSEELAQIAAATLMFRGHHRGSFDDFLAARDMLRHDRFAESWPALLHLADCEFALGNWAAAQAVCARVHRLHQECGVAYAIEAICWQRLDDKKKSNQCEVVAKRWGADPFIAWLREHDVQGSLGSSGILPLPRWHRITYR